MIKSFHSLFLLLFLVPSVLAVDVDFSGWIGVEQQHFYNDSLILAATKDSSPYSLAFEPEVSLEYQSGKKQVRFKTFHRFDSINGERSHSDLRELSFIDIHNDWELLIGVSKVFWGVTESQHLVDVINQTDLVESSDGEEKLGQPMIQFIWISPQIGNFEFFILPYFRERTLPGKKDRLQFIPSIDVDSVYYESGEEEKHIDYAFRWSHTLGDFDIGLSFFDGTQRDPEFKTVFANDHSLVFHPYYVQMEQFGMDIQYTYEGWLLKGEAIYRKNIFDEYFSSVIGFEYSFVGILESSMDLGLLMEHLYDDRGSSQSIFDDHLFMGLRLVLNDEQSTEILAGLIYGLDTDSQFLFCEFSRRLAQRFTIDIETRLFEKLQSDQIGFFLKNEDYLQVQLKYHF